ncbi:MAG: class I SAM-dependent methyltransferase [Chloroflexota bacterium]|nr:class I SAM-dependent methyltransferase [Chloroflexota bacterium]
MRVMYQRYAPIYRRMNQGAWSERMAYWTLAWLRARGVDSGQLVDWGCGDGAAAVVFANAGWQVLGIDQSPTMLQLAAQRTPKEVPTLRWERGDLRRTWAGNPGGLATAFYDTLNYLATLADLQAAWHTLAHSVQAGGYVVVDVNTPYEYATAWTGQHVITADTDDVLVINRLRYNARSGIARGRVVWFAREDADEQWRRGAETHIQRAHTDAEMVSAIEQAGLSLLERHTPHGAEPSATSTRLIYIAHKPGRASG